MTLVRRAAAGAPASAEPRGAARRGPTLGVETWNWLSGASGMALKPARPSPWASAGPELATATRMARTVRDEVCKTFLIRIRSRMGRAPPLHPSPQCVTLRRCEGTRLRLAEIPGDLGAPL